MSTLLVATIFLPIGGALCIWIVQDKGKVAFRQSAMVTTLLTLVLAGILVFNYEPGTGERASEPFAGSSLPWLGGTSAVDVQFSVGLDGLSLWLFGLTALLMITVVLISWEAIDDRPGIYYTLLLMLETGMLGVFCARDIILFYVFFEFTLIPLFFLIGIWGSEQRRYAAMKFFLYTLAGSLLTFLGLLSIVLWVANHTQTMTFSIAQLTASLAKYPLPDHYQLLIFLALFAGFAIKVPLFPLHTWLPLAHVQAPAAGSVVLAGVLLKIGTYGFARFSIPMLPQATAQCAPWLLWLSVAGILYGALVALAQTDMKRLIAYSSVSHLGFCMLGLFALNTLSVQGSVLQMINHGLSTGGLFALVGMLYERYHTREIAQFGGLARRLPVMAFFMVVFTLSSIGLPGLNGFAGELPILQGMFARAWTAAPAALSSQFKTIAVLAIFGVVLGAWYMLWLVERVFFGPLHEPVHDHGAAAAGHAAAAHTAAGHAAAHAEIRDLSAREVLALAPLLVFVVWIGVQPDFFMRRMAPTLDPLAQSAGRQFDEAYAVKAQAAPQPQLADEQLDVTGDLTRVD